MTAQSGVLWRWTGATAYLSLGPDSAPIAALARRSPVGEVSIDVEWYGAPNGDGRNYHRSAIGHNLPTGAGRGHIRNSTRPTVVLLEEVEQGRAKQRRTGGATLRSKPHDIVELLQAELNRSRISQQPCVAAGVSWSKGVRGGIACVDGRVGARE